MVVDEDGNVLSTEVGSYESEPTIFTEVVYVEGEPEVQTLVVEDIVDSGETVTVEVPEMETVTVVEEGKE